MSETIAFIGQNLWLVYAALALPALMIVCHMVATIFNGWKPPSVEYVERDSEFVKVYGIGWRSDWDSGELTWDGARPCVFRNDEMENVYWTETLTAEAAMATMEEHGYLSVYVLPPQNHRLKKPKSQASDNGIAPCEVTP